MGMHCPHQRRTWSILLQLIWDLGLFLQQEVRLSPQINALLKQLFFISSLSGFFFGESQTLPK